MMRHMADPYENMLFRYCMTPELVVLRQTVCAAYVVGGARDASNWRALGFRPWDGGMPETCPPYPPD